VGEFREIVHDLQKASSNPLPQFLEYVLIRTGYRRMYAESKDPQDESRVQNIDELLNSAGEFHDQNPSSTLADYLDSVTLISDVDRYDSEKGITLMTLHMAKGLEFAVVFLVGMEEGILPHFQSREQEDDVEEERRLCYVGMTRAREMLYCVHCHERRIHGQFREQSPSPFLQEIPESAIETIGLTRPRYRSAQNAPAWRDRALPERRPGDRPPAPRPAIRPDPTTNVLSFFENAPVRFDPAAIQPAGAKGESGRPAELTRGSRVRHEQFGTGVILKIEGAGDSAKLSVYFDRVGTKKFVAKFAKLTRA
jgi:DNA helicase-2/ATP-dependent DNA helicase PcrA